MVMFAVRKLLRSTVRQTTDLVESTVYLVVTRTAARTVFEQLEERARTDLSQLRTVANFWYR
jgi:hypothetical protein